jgi:hypothetical protein
MLLFIVSSKTKCPSCGDIFEVTLVSYCLALLIPCVPFCIAGFLMINDLFDPVAALVSMTTFLIAGYIVSPYIVNLKKKTIEK